MLLLKEKNKFLLKQAVILAGGQGERLKPLTNTIPKPMAPVNELPFLDYLIYSIIRAGIKDILILVGYKSEIIIERYKTISGVKIDFSFASETYNTGKRLINAYSKLNNHFLLMYGDNYWPIEINKMWENYKKLQVEVSTTVFSNTKGTGEYGFENNVVVSKNNLVSNYDKERKTREANGVDIGYFIVSKKSINPNIKDNISYEENILPELIKQNMLGAFSTNKQYYYITNIRTLKNFEREVLLNNFLPLPKKYFEV